MTNFDEPKNDSDYEEYQEFLRFKEMKRQQNYAQQSMNVTKYCKYCGSVIDSNSQVCPVCGQQLGSNQRPTIKPNNVDNNIMYVGKYEIYPWLLAIIPIISALVARFGVWASLTVFIAEIVIWKVDKDTLENLGFETDPWAYWIFVCTPVYLFMRASKINRNWAPAIINTVIFALAVIGLILEYA